MTKRPTKSRSTAPTSAASGSALGSISKPGTYPIAGTSIEAAQVYLVPARHPRGSGPWDGEAEKIAWTDLATGLRCIILRNRNGTLGGYVAITQAHPLFGFNAAALPDAMGIIVHGGISHAKACDENGPEHVVVCHPDEHAEQLWWFGFSCDHPYDAVPGAMAHPLAEETGPVYRDQDYVYRAVVNLAAQMKAIETSVGIGTGRSIGNDGSAGGDAGVPLHFTPVPPRGLDQ